MEISSWFWVTQAPINFLSRCARTFIRSWIERIDTFSGYPVKYHATADSNTPGCYRSLLSKFVLKFNLRWSEVISWSQDIAYQCIGFILTHWIVFEVLPSIAVFSINTTKIKLAFILTCGEAIVGIFWRSSTTTSTWWSSLFIWRLKNTPSCATLGDVHHPFNFKVCLRLFDSSLGLTNAVIWNIIGLNPDVNLTSVLPARHTKLPRMLAFAITIFRAIN